MFSGVLSEGCPPGDFLFVVDAVSLKFFTHNSKVLQLGTHVPMILNMFAQCKPDAVQTSTPWQLKFFESC
jgi:hypothetical protein